MKYSVGGKHFRTKSEIVKHIQGILHGNPVGKPIPSDDMDFLIDLVLTQHRWAKEKIGCGVESVRININPVWKNKGFVIHRVDGTCTDFSFMECINKPSDWKRSDVISACRRSVMDQILSFKSNFFSKNQDAVCVITGEKLHGNSHVDHVPPQTFESLFKEWVSEFGININSVEVSGYGDGEVEKYFVDSSVSKSFMDFHAKRAILRVISKNANLSVTRKSTKLSGNT